MPSPARPPLRELRRRSSPIADSSIRGAILPRPFARLRNLPGIGEWTAQYIAMRALGESDAFLAGDVAVQRKLALADGDDGG